VSETFGAQIASASPSQVLQAERDSGVAPPAAASIDPLVTDIASRSLSGIRIADLRNGLPESTLDLLSVTDAQRDLIRQSFDLGAQQARGAWFLPEAASVNIGWANLPYHFHHQERFASGIAHTEGGKIALNGSADGLFYWTVLEPLFSWLYRPIELRGPAPPTGDREEQRAAWNEVETFYSALSVTVSDVLEHMRYGSGWSKLHTADQLATKKALLDALRERLPIDVGGRYRAWASQALISKYYEKARRAKPGMRQVLTRPLQRVLAGFFGGDWLAFLRYLGEEPSLDEQISTALPEPRLYVNASKRAKAAAVRHGIAVEEIERMLGTFWSSDAAESPVHQRISVLREYWRFFDTIHTRQAPGMRPLWGFVEEGEGVSLQGVDHSETGPPWYHPGQWHALLPAQLIDRIRTLWEGLFLPAYPERIVTAISPCARMSDALGPALRFWNGSALTAWFVSEGPSSRTDMEGLADYHARDLKELAALGCPVDSGLFVELIAAEKKLGRPEPLKDPEHESSISVAGVTLSLSMTIGSRRAGFERLRDILNRSRQQWTERLFDTYLKTLWETEIRATAREYNRLLEVKRKAPTPKQFAKYAEPATNHWFGGDVSLLYAAFGEKSPVTPTRVRLLPSDIQQFMLSVFRALGGEVTDIKMDDAIDQRERERRQAVWNAHWKRKQLAELSVRYTQLREALCRRPEMAQLGTRNFEYIGVVLNDDIATAWEQFASAVDSVLGIAR